MAKTHVFPQTGDNDDAENFAQMIGQHVLADYVETGMNFTVDYSVPEVTISTGLCFIRIGSDTASSTGETRLSPNHAVQVEQATISLADSATNHIFVEPDFQTDDNAIYSSYTDPTNAPSDVLKIGEIDTSNDTSTQENRAPDANFADIDFTGDITVGDTSELFFGDGQDLTTRYDTNNDWVEFVDTGSGKDVLRLASDGSHHVQIPSGKLTIDTGGTGSHIDLTTGDVVGVDDIQFADGSGPSILTPNVSTGFLRVADRFNNTEFFVLNNGGSVEFPDHPVTVNGRRVPARIVNVPFTEMADGDNAIGLQFRVPSGYTLGIYEGGVQDASNSVPAGLDVVARDMTNASDIYSISSLHSDGSPLATKSGGVDVRIMVRNGTGGTLNASGYMLVTMEN